MTPQLNVDVNLMIESFFSGIVKFFEFVIGLWNAIPDFYKPVFLIGLIVLFLASAFGWIEFKEEQ